MHVFVKATLQPATQKTHHLRPSLPLNSNFSTTSAALRSFLLFLIPRLFSHSLIPSTSRLRINYMSIDWPLAEALTFTGLRLHPDWCVFCSPAARPSALRQDYIIYCVSAPRRATVKKEEASLNQIKSYAQVAQLRIVYARTNWHSSGFRMFSCFSFCKNTLFLGVFIVIFIRFLFHVLIQIVGVSAVFLLSVKFKAERCYLLIISVIFDYQTPESDIRWAVTNPQRMC